MDKILIIQDSPAVNMMLRFRLEWGGFSVDTAETGNEGVRKAGSDKYRLILVDYKLPDIDGGEVCRILKKDLPQDVPIVFLSALDEDKLSAIVKESGADGYIGEPFEGKEFVQKIKGFIKDVRREEGTGNTPVCRRPL